MSVPELTSAPSTGETGLTMGTIFNLSKAIVMVVDDNNFSLRLTTQTLLGFGIQTRYLCTDSHSAVEILKSFPIDLLIVDCDMPGPDGYDLVGWLRRSRLEPNAYTPALMISGHTLESQVTKARDCGASFIITRPITAAVLLERILWMARDPRAFVEAGDYVGPDRRFNEPQLPEGQEERRASLLRRQAAANEETGS
jgi:CheY-like chemotaxis protein